MKSNNFFISLISEKDENGEFSNISVGRVSFWLTFGLAMYIWIFTNHDVTVAHTQMLYITTTYNILKKSILFKESKEFTNKK